MLQGCSNSKPPSLVDEHFQEALRGRATVRTRGAFGSGKGTAQRSVSEGSRVALWDLDASTLEFTVKEITADNLMQLDIVDRAAVADAARDSAAQLGEIDILISCAGVTGASVPVQDFPIDSWRRVIDIV